MTTHSLILETHNLEGGDGDVAQGLERLLADLQKQTYRLRDLEDFVITHRGLTSAQRAHLDKVAGMSIRWTLLDDSVGYYEAKNIGFDASSGDVCVFADADCWPEEEWLSELVTPFEDKNVRAVAGRTTYRRDLLGTAASTLDFMYWQSTFGPGYVRNFYANNVAFHRNVFSKHRYGEHSMYRGHCGVLGIDLHNAGVPIKFVPAARTIHKFPDSVRELLQLRFIRGLDIVQLTPHLGRTISSQLELPKIGPVVPLAVLGIRVGMSLNSINKQQMPRARGLKWLAVAGVTSALSAVDAMGALVGGLGLYKVKQDTVLSYHGEDAKLAA